jgi:flavin reductase (DIM6/NTAB) family NADH-FMN oxidoreductase RutF
MEKVQRAPYELPCSVVLITVDTGKQRDIMTASAMYTSVDPPLLSISIAKHAVTKNLIDEARQFTANVASTAQVDLAKGVGSVHGSEADKFERFRIKAEPGSKIRSPVIKDSFASAECEVKDSLEVGDYVVYVGEVVAYRVELGLKPLVWLKNRYYSMGAEYIAGVED